MTDDQKALGTEHLMLNGVRAFDQLAQREKEDGAHVVIDRPVDLPVVQLIEQRQEDLNATDGMQRGIDRVSVDGADLTEHLCVSIVNEVGRVRFRASLENELFVAGDGIVVEYDRAHEFAVVHGFSLRFGEHVRTFVLEFKLIPVGGPELVEALDNQRLQVETEEVEGGQLTGEARQILTFRRAADVAFVEHFAILDAPRKVGRGD